MNPDWTDQLDRDARLRWLGSRHAGSVVAALSILPQSYFHALGTQAFIDWRDDFEHAYDELRGQHEDEVSERFNDMHRAGLDDVERIIDVARNAGVAWRWKFEQLFAEQGGESASKVLAYGSMAGGRPVDERYDDEQLSQLRGGERASSDGDTLVGHHVNSVKNTLSEHGPREALWRANDPDNVRIVTHERHVAEHGGDFRHPTSGEATEVSDRHDALVNESARSQAAEALDRAHALAIDTALAVGLAAGSLSAVIRLWQLRTDPRPWQQRAGLAAIALAQGTASGIVVSLGAQAGGHLARELMAECASQFAHGLGEEASTMVLTDLVGSGAAMAVGALIRVSFRTMADLRQGRPVGQVASDAVGQLGRVGVEQAGFLLIGVLLDCVTPIPDPIIGPIVTTLRVTYSVSKLGFGYWNDRQSACEIRLIRIEWMVSRARLACA